MIMHSCSQVEAWTYPEYTRHQTVLAGLPPSANLPQRGPPRRTSGQAAQLAGVSRVVFLFNRPQWNVPAVNWDADELAAEFKPIRS